MKRKDWILFFISVATIVLSFSVFYVFNENTIAALTVEDGFYESVGAIGIFIGSILLSIQFYRDRSGNDFIFTKTNRNYFLLMLAVLFFFVAGEEISWGQRIFHLSTPDTIANVNAQKELNIHNLQLFHGKEPNGQRKTGWALLLNMDFLFSLFWFLYCVVLPVAVRFIPFISRWVRRFNIPVVPTWVGVLFLGTYITTKILERGFSEKMQDHLTEIKECDLELLLGLAGVLIFSNYIMRRRAASLSV